MENVGMKLIQMFDIASKNRKFPHISWRTDDGNEYEFKRAGAMARVPGVVHIKYNHDYIGTIDRNGNIHLRVDVDRHQGNVEQFCRAPIDNAAVSGKKYNCCCFCGSELTNASSVYHGYGPICASNWGLPWGDVPEKTEEEVVEQLSAELAIEQHMANSAAPEAGKTNCIQQLPTLMQRMAACKNRRGG